VSAPAPRSHDSTCEAATARRGKARPHLASDREAGRGSCGPAYPERESVASSDGRQRRVLPFVQTHANDHASRMSTAHTRRSRHSRVVYARNARCVPASAGGYPERLVSTTGCEGHERRWQTRCRSGTRVPTGSCPGPTQPSRSGISLSKQGHASPRRGGQPGRAPSRRDACWASARQARPESGGDAAGRSLPSERTEGRPQHQLTWPATRRDGCADALSQADVPERMSGIARLARAIQRGQ
jgi:hypothetical protein